MSRPFRTQIQIALQVISYSQRGLKPHQIAAHVGLTSPAVRQILMEYPGASGYAQDLKSYARRCLRCEQAFSTLNRYEFICAGCKDKTGDVPLFTMGEMAEVRASTKRVPSEQPKSKKAALRSHRRSTQGKLEKKLLRLLKK